MNNYILLVILGVIGMTFVFLVLFKKKTVRLLNKIISPRHSYYPFLKEIKKNGLVLDVGCGNNSPFRVKSERPDIVYTGLDIGDYNQTQLNIADHYILTTAENFAKEIERMEGSFDAVISAHNLEHCDERSRTLTAMANALKSEGLLFLAFPTEKSVHFPSRKGTLNYYDDVTHKGTPPEFKKVVATLRENNMEILFARKSYKPFFLFLRGFFTESKSKRQNLTTYPTWAYYGFEAIVWAKKI